MRGWCASCAETLTALRGLAEFNPSECSKKLGELNKNVESYLKGLEVRIAQALLTCSDNYSALAQLVLEEALPLKLCGVDGWRQKGTKMCGNLSVVIRSLRDAAATTDSNSDPSTVMDLFQRLQDLSLKLNSFEEDVGDSVENWKTEVTSAFEKIKALLTETLTDFHTIVAADEFAALLNTWILEKLPMLNEKDRERCTKRINLKLRKVLQRLTAGDDPSTVVSLKQLALVCACRSTLPYVDSDIIAAVRKLQQDAAGAFKGAQDALVMALDTHNTSQVSALDRALQVAEKRLSPLRSNESVCGPSDAASSVQIHLERVKRDCDTAASGHDGDAVALINDARRYAEALKQDSSVQYIVKGRQSEWESFMKEMAECTHTRVEAAVAAAKTRCMSTVESVVSALHDLVQLVQNCASVKCSFETHVPSWQSSIKLLEGALSEGNAHTLTEANGAIASPSAALGLLQKNTLSSSDKAVVRGRLEEELSVCTADAATNVEAFKQISQASAYADAFERFSKECGSESAWAQRLAKKARDFCERPSRRVHESCRRRRSSGATEPWQAPLRSRCVHCAGALQGAGRRCTASTAHSAASRSARSDVEKGAGPVERISAECEEACYPRGPRCGGAGNIRAQYQGHQRRRGKGDEDAVFPRHELRRLPKGACGCHGPASSERHRSRDRIGVARQVAGRRAL